MEIANAQAISTTIDPGMIDKIFHFSVNLNADSIMDFI